MLRRPQRTEARLRAGGEDGAYLRAPPFEGVGGLAQTVALRAAKRKPLRLKREHGAYRRRVLPRHGERTSQRHGACGAALHAACARCRCRIA